MENNWSVDKYEAYVKMVNDREFEWMTALNIYLNAEWFRVDQTGGMVMVPTFYLNDEFVVMITPPERISELGEGDEWTVGLDPLAEEHPILSIPADRYGTSDDAFTTVANSENVYADIVTAVHALIAKHTIKA